MGERLYIMCRTEDGVTVYAPLYIFSFILIAPRRLLDAQQFNLQYQRYEDIDNIPDRLRWCRHAQGLMQKEVAESVGITEAKYNDIENGKHDFCAGVITEKLAALYHVPVTDLLDDYNLFLYNGQGRQLLQMRQSLGMNRTDFAHWLGCGETSIKTWETDSKKMFRRSWERFVKGKL